MQERESHSAEEGPVVTSSPFGRHDVPVDRWIKVATWAVVTAVVVLAVYLGYSLYSDARLRDTQSPAARAVANLAAAAQKNPKVAMTRVRLAEALMANNQQAEAIEQLQAALTLEKENVAALTDMGLIAMQRSEWSKAEGYWTNLITVLMAQEMATKDQRLADVYYFLGTTMVEQKRYEEAVANLKQSVAIKRDSSPVHYMLSVAYQRLAVPDMQKQELSIVLAFDPTYAQANYDMGLILLGEGDVPGAAELFRISADAAPNGVEDPTKQLTLLGNASERLAQAVKFAKTDAKQALYEARIAAAIDPSSVEAVRMVARLWEVNKDPDRAKNAWQRVLELVPGDTSATDAIKRLNTDAK